MKHVLMAAVAAATLAGASTPASAEIYWNFGQMMGSIGSAVEKFSGNMTDSFENTTARAEELPMAVLPLTAVGVPVTATVLGLTGSTLVLGGDAMTGAGDQVLGIME